MPESAESELGFKVAKKLGRKLFIDEDGNIRVLWGEGENQKQHLFSRIQDAVSQERRVIENYQGSIYKIEGEDGVDRTIEIPGEAKLIVRDIQEIQSVIMIFLSPENFSDRVYVDIQRKIGKVLGDIKRSSDQNKKRGREKISTLPVFTDHTGGVRPEPAVRLGEVSVDLLKRYEDVVNKTAGVMERGVRLIKEWMTSESKIMDARRRLLLIYDEINEETSSARLKNLVLIVTGEGGVLKGLNEVKANPFFSQRIKAYEIRRLNKLEEYFESNNVQMIKGAIGAAIKKLDRVAWDRKERKVEEVSF